MRALLVAACAALTACAAQPTPYHSQNEIPRGPGLLSGAEGAFVLRVGSSVPGDPAPPGDSAAPRNAAEEREYQEWREWKRRQEPGAN
jgi:hypothetical protein